MPLKYRNEYKKVIQTKLPIVSHQQSIKEIFCCLINPLVSFIDFGLIEYIIAKFGSDNLKKVMKTYSSDMKEFMKQTTVKQLIESDYFPGQPEVPDNFSLLQAKINKDASECTLEQINMIRRKYCCEVKLSEIVFHLVAIVESNSFIVRWLVPSPFIYYIMVSTRDIDRSFYQEHKIASLTVDAMWLFLSESEINTMWSRLHVNNTKIKDQFCTMHKQIVFELNMRKISEHKLSLHLMNWHPNLQQKLSLHLSREFLKHNFPVSFIDFRIPTIFIEIFGSDCLKRVMKSYCKEITKQSTAQLLIDLPPIHFKPSEYFIVAECRIKGKPSNYRLAKLLDFQTRFCAMANLNKLCFVMGEISTKINDSFTVTWLMPSPLFSDIMKSTRYMNQKFFQDFKITSFTLDTMWLYMSDCEIDSMWSSEQVSNSKLNDQVLAIYKQLLYELEIGKISEQNLSLYLMEQQPKLRSDVCVALSKAFFKHDFPLSFWGVRFLTVIIEGFGSDFLKRVMKYFCKYMTIFTMQSTMQQLMELSPVQSSTSDYFVIVKCKIMKMPSEYKLEQLYRFERDFCSAINISEICLFMGEINNEINDSFIVSWHVPSSLAFDLLQSANQLKDTELFQEGHIASLHVGSRWIYHHQLTYFGIQLKKQYQRSHSMPSPVEWIPSPTKKVFKLAMIQRERVQGLIEDRFVRMTISGKVDDILRAKAPVELENIFEHKLHGNEVILIEGAPGSGKSTLTVHISQKWGRGDLFQEFTIVILVQLRDPAVHRVQTLTDLLPIENAVAAQELASELVATNGRGVLWILDGWDELPSHLQQDSIFHQLVNRMLIECSVLVTSRPISSGDLHPVVSSRIEVLGFSPEEQRQYFTDCLKGDTKALKALLDKIEENPMVQTICYLPLNAAFIVYSFKMKGLFRANTEYEIYLTVILSCIQRHYEREGRSSDLPKNLASFDDLCRSEVVRIPFQHLCELAYHGVMKNRLTFTSSDLPQGSNTLSLLQAIESFLQSGKSMFYNFLHLSIQEVLSGYYIATWLSDSEVVSQFQELFNQPRFAAVFQFYAAITKLKSPGIRQVIARIVENKSKPLLMSLLRCLYEAQDSSLCLYVAEKIEFKLDLVDALLSPLDCFCISYFLSSVTVKEISVQLTECYIGDIGAKYLSKCLDGTVGHIGKVTINLSRNAILKEGASYISNMLYSVEHLYLIHNHIGDDGAFLISEAVRETTTLKTLILYRCGITSIGVEYLSKALAKNITLEKLDIGGHNLGDEGINHMAEALKQNKQLKELWISLCGMTDKRADSLASGLSINSSLKLVHMGGFRGALTKHGLLRIANSVINSSEFVKLAISIDFGNVIAFDLEQKINEARKRNGLLPIQIEGE